MSFEAHVKALFEKAIADAREHLAMQFVHPCLMRNVGQESGTIARAACLPFDETSTALSLLSRRGFAQYLPGRVGEPRGWVAS